MEQNNRRAYVCKRARMCSYLVSRGFHPYRITPDQNNPAYDVYLFEATPELYAAVMDYIAAGPRRGPVCVRLSKEDWENILKALSLAEEDRTEQAKYAMDQEDANDCKEAAAAYAQAAAAIREQVQAVSKN